MIAGWREHSRLVEHDCRLESPFRDLTASESGYDGVWSVRPSWFDEETASMLKL
jgi:hypothetical protein